jgi:hypothetical protein
MSIVLIIKAIRRLQLIQLETLDLSLEREIDAVVIQLHQALAELTAKKATTYLVS